MTYLSLPFPVIVAAGIVLFLFFIQLYYFIRCSKLSRYATASSVDNMAVEVDVKGVFPPLTVVIAAHNEGDLLEHQLPAILEQDYPEFEVIVINNISKDNTEDLLITLSQKYPHLHHTFIPDSSRNPSNKKLSLSLGIKASKYEWVVFTEPGYTPCSSLWLKNMAFHFSPSVDVVLGYSKFSKAKGLFATSIRLINLWGQFRFLVSALARTPYMGYGRNLAYRKNLFFENQGFSGYLYMKRGEDDLFLNRVANRNNTRVALSPESIVELSTLPTPRKWKREQCQRHETYRLLKGSQPFVWNVEAFSRIFFLLTANALLLYGFLIQDWVAVGLASSFLCIRFLLFFICMYKTCCSLGEVPFKTSLFFFTGIQLFHSLQTNRKKAG